MCLKERRHQARKDHLLDFRDASMCREEARDVKVKNQMGFRNFTNNVGRGRNKSLKELQVKD